MKEIVYEGASFNAQGVARRSLPDFVSANIGRVFPNKSEDVQREMLKDVHNLCCEAVKEPAATSTESNGDNTGNAGEVSGNQPDQGSSGGNGANGRGNRKPQS